MSEILKNYGEYYPISDVKVGQKVVYKGTPYWVHDGSDVHILISEKKRNESGDKEYRKINQSMFNEKCVLRDEFDDDANESVELLPTFESFVNEGYKINDIEVEEIAGELVDILTKTIETDKISEKEVIDSLKKDFNIVATSEQFDAIISSMKEKGIDVKGKLNESDKPKTYIAVDSPKYFRDIFNSSNNLSQSQQKFFDSIIKLAEKNKKVTENQYKMLKRLESGNVYQEDYHSKN